MLNLHSGCIPRTRLGKSGGRTIKEAGLNLRGGKRFGKQAKKGGIGNKRKGGGQGTVRGLSGLGECGWKKEEVYLGATKKALENVGK